MQYSYPIHNARTTAQQYLDVITDHMWCAVTDEELRKMYNTAKATLKRNNATQSEFKRLYDELGDIL